MDLIDQQQKTSAKRPRKTAAAVDIFYKKDVIHLTIKIIPVYSRVFLTVQKISLQH
jgi:hypothetical protein